MRLLLAAALSLLVAAPAAVQPNPWILGPWDVRDETGDYLGRNDEVSDALEAWTSQTLSDVAVWLHGLGFQPPALARVSTGDGRQYVATYDTPNTGECGTELGAYNFVMLTLCTKLLKDQAGNWIDPAAVGASDAYEANRLSTLAHELFHAVQETTLKPYVDNAEQHTWVVEGTATAVEYAWSDRTYGTIGYSGWPNYTLGLTDSTGLNPYTVGHFWYHAGQMIAPRGTAAIDPLRILFEQGSGWDGWGIAAVDAAFEQAVDAYAAPRAYEGGLYGVFPQYLAQHTDERHFGDSVPTLELAAPAARDVEGDLLPLAAAALRVEVDVDDATLDVRGVPVRFTLETDEPPSPSGLDGTTLRDQLHLIVGERVAGRPALPSTPYNHVVQVFGDTTLVVRVANVAPDAARTWPAAFTLRVEALGFFGEDADGPSPIDLSTDAGGAGGSAVDVAGALPPGFAVNGPGPWACRGGAGARAVFDLMTPDELGQDVERALPEFAQDMDDMMDQMELAMQRAERMGRDTGMTREQMAALREEARAAFEQAETEHGGEIDRAADEVRAEPNTILGATFVGSEAGEDCQMTLGATLLGREGGAQIIPGAVDPDRYPDGEEPDFGVMVYPRAILDMMQGMGAAMADARPGEVPASLATLDDTMDGWQVCTMTDEERRRARDTSGDCPPVLCTTGQLVLEEAEQGRIAGSFQFEVLQWPNERTGRCHMPTGRDTVTGHFNVASSDDGTDDNSLSGIGLGGLGTGQVPIVPGTPILDWDLDD